LFLVGGGESVSVMMTHIYIYMFSPEKLTQKKCGSNATLKNQTFSGSF